MTPQTNQALTILPDPVPVLLGRVYAEAPVRLKRRLLEHLLKPLGLLSLTTVCNGAFATLALSGDWSRLGVHSDMAQSLDSEQVMVLTDYVQQVNWHAVTNLSQVLSGSPVLQGSMAASALLALLLKRKREHPKPSQRDLEDLEP